MKTTMTAVFLLLALGATAADWTNGVAYVYDDAGNIRQLGGDVQIYDAAGRLVQSDTNGVRRNYEYDAFGNRQKCLQTPSTDCQFGRTVSAGTNRVNGISYDTAGNVLAQDGHAFTYDALNIQIRDSSAGTVQEYIYTADDERIAVYAASTGFWRWTLRDASKNVLREYTSQNGGGTLGGASWTWARDYVWRDGQLLASRQMVQGSPATFHYHLDHLGTPRRITDDANHVVGEHAYHAFGVETTDGQNESPLTPLKFTGHERDGVLDYMHARFYDPVGGRFLSVDPKLNLNRAQRQPQNWNRYSYVMNDPLRYTDPAGEDVSIRLVFNGEGWTDEEKNRIMAMVLRWYKNSRIGKVYVFDGAKANHGANFLRRMFSEAYASIEVSSATGAKHTADVVYAGNYANLPTAQRLNAIANTIIHETAAHHFGVTAAHQADQMYYLRDGGYRYWDSVRQRYGTVADSWAYADQATRANVTDGPIPIHPDDLKTMQNKLRNAHAEPPDYDR